MQAKVKESIISSEWGDVIANSNHSITVRWGDKLGIYSKDKNEIQYRKKENENE